nr:hypothetical protein [Candidatus Freyarchaeota archaeon]
MTEFVIKLENLFLLLNGLYLNGAHRFSVRSLLLNRDLFHVELSNFRRVSKVSKLIPEDIYHQLRNRCGEVIGEIPGYDEYQDIFLASGVHKPDNWDQTREEIVEKLSWDSLKSNKRVFVSFDTNALRRRYYTLISNFIKSENTDREKDKQLKASFVISKGVKAELEHFDNKYGESDISLMFRTLNEKGFSVNREILAQFFNQLKLKDRLCIQGYVEYLKMSNLPNCEEVEGEKTDIKILDSLEEFRKKKDVELLVFGQDYSFNLRAIGRKLNLGELKRPINTPESVEVGWEQIAQLLYTAAITCGAIGIDGGAIKAKIFGIWMGKGREVTVWNEEKLKIITESTKLKEFLETNQKILQNKT